MEDPPHHTLVRIEPLVVRPNVPLPKSLITCYQNVYAGDPWFEWRRCNCRLGTTSYYRKWPPGTELTNCPDCHAPLTEFWPASQVEQDIRSEAEEKDAAFFVALTPDNTVVGAAWGYRVGLHHLEQKLDLPGRLIPVIANLHGNNVNEVIYLDDLIVHPNWQGHGIMQSLVAARFRSLLNPQTTCVVYRTNPKTKTFTFYQKHFGFGVICAYGGEDNRVILSANPQSFKRGTLWSFFQDVLLVTS